MKKEHQAEGVKVLAQGGASPMLDAVDQLADYPLSGDGAITRLFRSVGVRDFAGAARDRPPAPGALTQPEA